MKHKNCKKCILKTRFNDTIIVHYAGLQPISEMLEWLDLQNLTDQLVERTKNPATANPGSKLLTAVASMLAGGTHIDHVNLLHAGGTGRVTDFRMKAGNTIGEWLRQQTEVNLGQLTSVCQEAQSRVWEHTTVLANNRLTIDVDSTHVTVTGEKKEGARFNRLGQLSYKIIVSSRDDTTEVIGSRLLPGASRYGKVGFVRKVIEHTRQASGIYDILLRADAGFFSADMISALQELDAGWSIGVPKHEKEHAAIAAIPETCWSDTKSTKKSLTRKVTQAAATYVTISTDRGDQKIRLVVRRSRKIGSQGPWRYQVFTVSNQNISAVDAELLHRKHARVEKVIRDLKQSAGLSHLPSGKLLANAVWLLCATLVYNVVRWYAILGGRSRRLARMVVGRTIHNQFFSIPGRIVNNGGYMHLRLPDDWPHRDEYLLRLRNILRLPPIRAD